MMGYLKKSNTQLDDSCFGGSHVYFFILYDNRSIIMMMSYSYFIVKIKKYRDNHLQLFAHLSSKRN